MKDSVDKIITTYFSLLCDEEFEYKNKIYSPTIISVGESLLRGLVCPPNCGACCRDWTLDWLPSEEKDYRASERYIDFNNSNYLVYTDLNDEALFCRHLTENARCSIHKYNPLSCDFEIIRLIHREKNPYITTTYYGRSWNMLKVTGERGAECVIVDNDEDIISDIKRKLFRLEDWFNHFEIKSKIPTLISWIDSDNHKRLYF